VLRDWGLAQQAINDVPKGGEARVDELDGFVARRGNSGVNVFLILDEEWFEIRLVDMGRALELWEGEKKKEQRLCFPIERKPVKKPFGGVLESNKNTNHCPVASPLLQLLFIQRALLERFESRVGWEEKSEPSSEKARNDEREHG